MRITLPTSLSPQEIRDYYGKARLAGARHDVMISLYFRDLDAGESRFIVEFIDSYRNPWDWLCGGL
ncbi:hypothetical protein [Herbidospora sp. NBRC 101105]|uniref:hypothetical protein n=1 Tax=Herbidospora sp. NBRC 101105 TaxID=3032195 RepID=UPI0024A0876F|nr:hypothetical protein [Herbidospora sp. NBRC 101105]GLX94739.1 hypothetical protein Hesp01_26890 [Herbidospora sp. NBRC 101105]